MLKPLTFTFLTVATVGIAIVFQANPIFQIPEGITNAALEDSTDDLNLIELPEESTTDNPLNIPANQGEGTGQTPEDLLLSPELNEPLTESDSQTPFIPFTEPATSVQAPPVQAPPVQAPPVQQPVRPARPFAQTTQPTEIATIPEDINGSAFASGSAEPSGPPIPGLW